MSRSMMSCRTDIKERMVKLCTTIHPNFGERLAKAVNITPPGEAKL